MIKPSEKYQDFLQRDGFHEDAAQRHALVLLDALQDQLLQQSDHWIDRILKRINRLRGRYQAPKGLYFWGGVGRGKTFLMDIFYQTLPIEQKKRIHFHKFMKQIHDQLSLAGTGVDPLYDIAAAVADHSRVLCLDEFVVTDIGDAMLIGRLLKALFEQDVVMVMTSNSAPEDLYKDGLQRANFLPAIDLIQSHCDVYRLDSGEDYRMLGLTNTELYHYPSDEQSLRRIQQFLEQHTVAGTYDQTLTVNSREIPYRFCAEDTIWFDFEQLCKSARSRLDYLEIAQTFGTLILTGIEQMDNATNDAAKRFIALIDVLYDHRVKLVCTADVAHDQLYRQGSLSFEFQRTSSRLREMQSGEYFTQQHRS